ncbi:Ig-like domain-containing protein [Nitrosomonas sp. ANs5]|uniref:Ig-like domain-containing protein n=1 Tax=Nitrosomonas sp. ANs5 TaxID=3423941 RepID=UPI003D33345A
MIFITFLKLFLGISPKRHLLTFPGKFLLCCTLFCVSSVQAGPPEGKGWRRNLDTQAPTVSITSPTSGTTYTTAQTVTISASASDNVGVSKVEFYLNGALHSTDTSPPYNASWPITSTNNGSHTWSARAYDAAGNNAASTTVSLTVNITSSDSTDTTPPTVTITSPASGTTYTTAQTVTISASASDDVGVSKVEFYQNGVLRSTHSSAPYSVGWSISSAQNGTHSWTAKAFDAAGNTNTSTAVSLTVNIADSNDTDNTKQESGAHLWSRMFGTSGVDRANGITVANNGDVVITGYYANSASFGGGTLPCASTRNMVVARYNPDGMHIWSACVDRGTGSVTPFAVAIDASDNVIVTGSFSGTVPFGSQSVTSSGNSDVFIAKYSVSGKLVWVQKAGGANADAGYGIAVGSAQDIIVTGYQNNPDVIFLSKYAPTGTLKWSKQFSGQGNNVGRDVAIDGQGNILITGTFYGTIQLEGSSVNLTSSSSWNPEVLLAKFDAAGKLVWARGIGDVGEEQSWGIAVDQSTGDSVITGYFFETSDFGGGAVTTDRYSMFLAKYNVSGKHLWSNVFIGEGRNFGLDVAIDQSTGDVLMAGTFRNSSSFGGSTLTSQGAADLIIARYKGDTGDHLWSKALGGPSADGLGAVSLSESGQLYATGYFTGEINFGGAKLTGDSVYGDIFLVRLAP